MSAKRSVLPFLGKKISNLLIYDIDYAKSGNGFNKTFVNCLCGCGNKKSIRIKDVVNKKTTTCGCAAYKALMNRAVTHNMSGTTEYAIYSNMLTRCLNEKATGYINYGGRGIKVCDRWLESFENFYADMGNRPSLKYSLDRKNNDGNYEPSNCRWATKKEQNENRRPSKTYVFIEYKGEIKTLAAWADYMGIHRCTLHDHVRKNNEPMEIAVENILKRKFQK